MASQICGLIQDQNLNLHYNGASAGGKTNAFKTLKKGGGLGGRKPLGDLSNSVKPTPNQSIKKQNPKDYSVTGKEIGASKITFDGSKKKSSRKALSDISNSSKPPSRDVSKKNLKGKQSILSDEHLCSIAEEGFLHNHDECIKAQRKAMDIDEFLETVGLDHGFLMQPPPPSIASPLVGNSEPASPLKLLELEQKEELQLEYKPSAWKYENLSELESPFPSKTPKSLKWDNDDYHVNFMLIESPTKY